MQNVACGAGCRQVNLDHGFHFDDARGELDETQAQRVELRDAPHRALRHQCAEAPQEPIGAGVEEQAKLIGDGRGAGGSVGGQMRLPRLDVVFHNAAAAIDVLVESASVAAGQVGDDEARVGSVGAGLDAGDDALDPAPARSAVEEFLEAAHFAILGSGIETRLCGAAVKMPRLSFFRTVSNHQQIIM
jgi:hypothetical protein